MNRIWILLRYDWPLHAILFLTNWLPDNVVFLRWRGYLVRPFFGKCGRMLNIGRNVTFHDPAQIHIGDFVHISYGCMFMAAHRISIDDEVMFGPYCVVTTGNHTCINGSYRFSVVERLPIHIQKGVWLATHVTVTPGVIIGAGSLIAAGAVVVENVPNGVMVGGIPAHVIKSIKDGNL